MLKVHNNVMREKLIVFSIKTKFAIKYRRLLNVANMTYVAQHILMLRK